MTNSDLVALNEAQQAARDCRRSPTRATCTAGSIRLLDPRICAERRLRFFCHGVGLRRRAAGHRRTWSSSTRCGGYGLPPTPLVECFDSFDAAVEHCEELIERLHELDFEIDGLVLKVNRFDQRERLGSHVEEPALGDRLQVREVRSHDAAQRDPRPGGQDRRDHAGGRPGAGRTGRHDRQPRQPAQRRRDRAQGRPRRATWSSSRRRARSSRTSSASKSTCARASCPKFAFPTTVPRVRHAGWSRTKAASTSAARTPSARPRSRSGSATSPAATRWTSKGWATSWSINWSARAWSAAYGDLYRLTLEQLAEPGADGQEVGGEPARRRSRRARTAGWRGCSTRCRSATSARAWRACWPSISARSTPCWRPTSSELSRGQRDRPDHRRERLRLSAQRVRRGDDRRPPQARREDGVEPRRRAEVGHVWRARRSSSPAR